MLDLSNVIISKNPEYKTYLRKAYSNAWSNSTDNSTKVWSVLICRDKIILGVNHFVKGFDYKNISEIPRELKYANILHAEQDAIHKAAQYGIMTQDSTLYAPWFACSECMKAIINSGISKVVGHLQIMEKPHKLQDSINESLKTMNKAGLELILYDGKIGKVKSMFSGEIWEP